MENLEKREQGCKDNGITFMHTWRYQRSTFPIQQPTRNHLANIQRPTGYKWNMDFAKDCQYAVLVLIATFRGKSTCNIDGQPLLEAVLGSFSNDNMVGLRVTIMKHITKQECDVANQYWHHVLKYSPLMGHVDRFNWDPSY